MIVNNKSKQNKAFTLVELSIVIVIIGLLVGGVTAGVSMVRQAGLRAAITELNKYKTAINAFKLQYNALPGDMSNATSYWPNPINGISAANGNNNRFIAASWTEGFQSWTHLSFAGLIEGQYTGAIVAVEGGVIGTNLPVGPLRKSGFSIRAGDTATSNFSGNVITFGVHPWAGDYTVSGAVLTGGEAFNIDTKLDDGLPTTGQIRIDTLSTGGGCNSGGVYVITDNVIRCAPAFGF